jgi:hypothetical protein
MNPINVANMLYSTLIFLGSIFGALNLHQWLKYKKIIKECRRLEAENDNLKSELIICNDNAAK